MDRPGTQLTAIGLLCVAVLAGASAAITLPIRAARWLAPGADAVRALTEKPSECLARPATADEAYAVEVGRAAFQSPLVLGGQASRAGLSCEACHRNGRTNPLFFFQGISGKPGTADVTSSVFSSHRGDGIDNPKPIPDLSGPRRQLKISRDPRSSELKTFIHGLVTREFDGAEPPPAVLAGLAAYVRALNPAACPRQAVQAIRMESLMDDTQRAVQAADAAFARKDGPTAIVMLGAARSLLGQIYERYAAAGLNTERAAIEASNLDLRAAQDAIRDGGKDVSTRLIVWQSRARQLTARLARREKNSLFDSMPLALALRQIHQNK